MGPSGNRSRSDRAIAAPSATKSGTQYPNGGIGPGRQGLQGVSCRPGRGGRHLCVADIAGDGGELRFVMAAPQGRPVQATELELE